MPAVFANPDEVSYALRHHPLTRSALKQLLQGRKVSVEFGGKVPFGRSVALLRVHQVAVTELGAKGDIYFYFWQDQPTPTQFFEALCVIQARRHLQGLQVDDQRLAVRQVLTEEAEWLVKHNRSLLDSLTPAHIGSGDALTSLRANVAERYPARQLSTAGFISNKSVDRPVPYPDPWAASLVKELGFLLEENPFDKKAAALQAMKIKGLTIGALEGTGKYPKLERTWQLIPRGKGWQIRAISGQKSLQSTVWGVLYLIHLLDITRHPTLSQSRYPYDHPTLVQLATEEGRRLAKEPLIEWNELLCQHLRRYPAS